MTEIDQTTDAPPQGAGTQNLAMLKGITAALGLLLVGGVALLGVLLFTRDTDEAAGPEAAVAVAGGAAVEIALLPSETVTGETLSPAGGVWTIEDADGGRRIVFVSAATGLMTTVRMPAE